MQRIINIAAFAGRVMLENGAETYRVEDMINRISKSRGLDDVQSFSVPTGIFIACNYGEDNYSTIIRTNVIDIDLEIITMLNNFSREFVNSDMSLDDAERKLKKIKNAPHFQNSTICTAGGIAGGFFTLMFGGNLVEFLLAFITSFVAVYTVRHSRRYIKSFFVINVLGGAANMLCAILLAEFYGFFGESVDIAKVVIGSMMPLVPGVAMTNALRDSISGDTISGVAKLLEALVVAVAIAIGVGTVMQIKLLLTGGL